MSAREVLWIITRLGALIYFTNMEAIVLRKGLNIRVWLLVVLTVLALGTSCAPSSTPSGASSGAAIKIEPSASAVQVNDMVRVSVKVENIANLTAFEIHLSFNAAVLEVVELVDGGFVKADFTVQNIFDNAAGTIDYAAAQINRAPANGSGVLLEIVFRAKAGGDSPIRFRTTQAASAGALLADANGMAIQVSLIEGSVNVK